MGNTYYSHGKLLLTGEYAVLDGALGLAIPTRFGQSLKVLENTNSKYLEWKSFDKDKSMWFRQIFDLNTLESQEGVEVKNMNATLSKRLSKVLNCARNLNPDFLNPAKGIRAETFLDFNREWGLGSSSTLINNIAQWAEVDAYQLLWDTFGGSGYDIACAQSDSPLLYCLKDGRPEVKKISFDPPFGSDLYFVYLNQKMDSRKAIKQYRDLQSDNVELVSAISKLSVNISLCVSLEDFKSYITEHEALLSAALKLPTVKEKLFPDFQGAIKSLGAWGGDFVLAASCGDSPDYFNSRGYDTVIPYSKMAL